MLIYIPLTHVDHEGYTAQGVCTSFKSAMTVLIKSPNSEWADKFTIRVYENINENPTIFEEHEIPKSKILVVGK
jgi:hypothetical protein